VDQGLQEKYPGVTLEKLSEKQWKVNIPASYKVGHEAHFSQVTEKFLITWKREICLIGKCPT
jgi:hypothetical protein